MSTLDTLLNEVRNHIFECTGLIASETSASHAGHTDNETKKKLFNEGRIEHLHTFVHRLLAVQAIVQAYAVTLYQHKISKDNAFQRKQQINESVILSMPNLATTNAADRAMVAKCVLLNTSYFLEIFANMLRRAAIHAIQSLGYGTIRLHSVYLLHNKPMPKPAVIEKELLNYLVDGERHQLCNVLGINEELLDKDAKSQPVSVFVNKLVSATNEALLKLKLEPSIQRRHEGIFDAFAMRIAVCTLVQFGPAAFSPERVTDIILEQQARCVLSLVYFCDAQEVFEQSVDLLPSAPNNMHDLRRELKRVSQMLLPGNPAEPSMSPLPRLRIEDPTMI